MKRNRVANLLSWTLIGVLVLMPFHTLITTWLASNYNHFDLFRISKDFLIVFLGLGSLWLLYKDKKKAKEFFKHPLVILILVYGLLEVVYGIYAKQANHVNSSALIYGWINDLQYLGIFLSAIVISSYQPIKQYWKHILLIPAGLVVVFGLAQHFVLSADFLRHFGYGQKTIPTYETVNQNSNYIRVQSTLRGPNPLGAYLILISSAITSLIILCKRKVTAILFAVATIGVLYLTYSRSAWIGTVIAVSLTIWLSLKSAKLRQLIFIGGTAVALLVAGLVVAFRNNNSIQSTFFHIDKSSTSIHSSNEKRASALENGWHDILHQPLGSGPGTAGPASVRNNHLARIAENYYVQIGQELGVIGLGLFLAINVMLALALWRQRSDTLSVILLASFLGISFVNMLSHAWADDTLAIIWWGMAGIAIAPSVIMTKASKKQHI